MTAVVELARNSNAVAVLLSAADDQGIERILLANTDEFRLSWMLPGLSSEAAKAFGTRCSRWNSAGLIADWRPGEAEDCAN